MRNILKYTILSVVAAVLIPLGMSAEDNLISLSKKVTDYGNKTYKLTLETFAEGSSSSTSDRVPTDFVLVMDHSGSMSNNNVTTDLISRVSTGTRLSNDAVYKVVVDNKEYYLKRFQESDEYFKSSDNPYSYNDIDSGSKTYYFKSGNEYHEVKGYTDNVGVRRYYIVYQGDLLRRYIGKDGSVETSVIGQYGDFSTQDPSEKAWDITLYEHQASGTSHYTYRYAPTLEELTDKNSGKEYVRTTNRYQVQDTDEIYLVSEDQEVTRLAAAINAAEWFIREVYRNNPTDPNKDRHSISIVWYADENNTTTSKYQKGDDSLVPLTSPTVVSNYIAGIDRYTSNGSSTYINSGLSKAYDILEPVKGNGHNKVVVVFTDGEPGSNAGHFHEGTARNALIQANRLKSVDFKNQQTPLKLYAIGLMSSGTANYHNTKTGGGKTDVDYSYTNDKYRFMNYISSNYQVEMKDSYSNQIKGFAANIPGAKCLDDITPHIGCNDHGDEAPHGYFQASDGKNLGEIFKKIATENSTVNALLTDATTVVFDAIKNCFTLPHPTSKDNIQIYTCDVDVTASGSGANVVWASSGSTSAGQKIVYKDAENNVIVTEGNTAPAVYDHAEYWVPLANKNNYITINGGPIAAEGSDYSDFVEVTGYNYVANYVGQVNTDGAISWHAGQKLIIQIDIVADPANQGGVEMNTNTAQSGVYVKNEQGNYISLEKYEKPLVTLPYIRLIKAGLGAGETALFNITKVTDDTGSTVDTSADRYSTNVMISDGQNLYSKGGKEYPSAQLKLLNTGWYKITESTWAWAYDVSHGITGADGIATTTNLVESNTYIVYFENKPTTSEDDNSFVEVFFKNTPKSSAVEHAEANVNNNMGNTYPSSNN